MLHQGKEVKEKVLNPTNQKSHTSVNGWLLLYTASLKIDYLVSIHEIMEASVGSVFEPTTFTNSPFSFNRYF